MRRKHSVEKVLAGVVSRGLVCDFRTLILHCSILTIGEIGVGQLGQFLNRHREFRRQARSDPVGFSNSEKRKSRPMSAFHKEKVLSVRHWTDTLFSFRATRDAGFRFQNGQFAMIGLEVDGRPLMRAYSMASANHEEELEFFSIKVADGPLTSRLQKIKEGDTILVGRKATGTLIADNLFPGKRLLLLSTGTGLAPFASLIKDPD